MKKLNNKVLGVLIFILSFFLLSILVIFNYQDYHQAKEKVKDNLFRMNSGLKIDENVKPNEDIEPPVKKENEPHKMFMDTIIYTIQLDSSNEITDIISHNENQTTSDEVKNLANEIIENNDIPSISIGNLYIDNYAYAYNPNNKLVIIDNTELNKELKNTLKTSIIIFILLEIIVVLVSLKLTKWITRPVIESFDKQKQFIADASHELKTPLAVIMASADALENDKDKKWLKNIQNEAERMNKLIMDLLDLARLENSKKDNYTINNLSKVIEIGVLSFESLIYEKKIKLDYDIDKYLILNSDVEQIKQLLVILLDNALKHSDEDGNINVTLKKENDQIILKVINKGEPIPKSEEEKIFERFYRIDKARNRNENRYGLGLAIAKNIVLNHNGKIKAYSTDGYTTFEVRFKK